jgi:hypothetical protein
MTPRPGMEKNSFESFRTTVSRRDPTATAKSRATEARSTALMASSGGEMYG